MRTHIISLLMLGAATAAVAQDLHQDITVEQAVDPVKRDAARIALLPTVTLPPLTQSALDYSNRVVTAPIPNTITTLQPVAWGDSLTLADYRGYVAGGVFPLYNAAVSAGYRFIDSDRTRLTAWGQYDASVYHRGRYATADGSKGRKAMWHDQSWALGVDLHRVMSARSSFDLGVDYSRGHHDMWNPGHDGTFSHDAARFNFDASVRSTHHGLQYGAWLKEQFFGFYSLNRAAVDPTHQNIFKLGGNARLETGEQSALGLDLEWDLVNTTSAYRTATIPYTDESLRAFTKRSSGVLRVTPYYMASSTTVSARIGAEMDIASNSGKALSFAPAASLAWAPTQIFGIEVKGTGGTELNNLASLYDGVTPYLDPTMAYRTSRVPYDLTGRMTFGPFLNVTVEAFGGYARANDWLMPVKGQFGPGGAVFEPLDVKGHHIGVSVGYDNGKLIAVKTTFTAAPGGRKHLYYMWRDRATKVADIDVQVRPIKGLLCRAGFEFRSGRSYWEYSPTQEVLIGNLMYYPSHRVSLGSVADLSLGADYTVTPELNVFVNGQNLLSRTYSHYGQAPSQGATALVGVSYKF